MARLSVEHSVRARVRLQGFESDTYTLQRCGWQIAVQQMSPDYYGTEDCEMVIKHDKLGITAIGVCRDFYRRVMNGRFEPMFGSMASRDRDDMCFEMTRCADHLYARGNNIVHHYSAFELIDATPNRIIVEDYDLATLPAFAPMDRPVGEELIVDPMDVAQLLDLIRRKQEPSQAEIRERTRKREIIPVKQATIFTFPTAA